MDGDAPKGPPKPTVARFAIAANLKFLMGAYRLQPFLPPGITPPQLEAGCGVSAKTINRLLDPYIEISPRLDNLDAIAHFFGAQTWELLKPRDGALSTPIRIAGRERQTAETDIHSRIALQQKKRVKPQKS